MSDLWVKPTQHLVVLSRFRMDLYRAVDSEGNTLEFLLSPTRDAEAAQQFFSKTLAASHTSEPRVMTVDKNAAYPKAFKELKEEGIIPDNCELRQVKYLNNIVEQDHVRPNVCAKKSKILT